MVVFNRYDFSWLTCFLHFQNSTSAYQLIYNLIGFQIAIEPFTLFYCSVEIICVLLLCFTDGVEGHTRTEHTFYITELHQNLFRGCDRVKLI